MDGLNGLALSQLEGNFNTVSQSGKYVVGILRVSEGAEEGSGFVR